MFKQKLRKIKIILNNKDYIESDMVKHKIITNTNVRFKSKETPIAYLLNRFERGISQNNNQETNELINASYKTINFLEKFYKC